MWVVYLALDLLVAPYPIAKAQLVMHVVCKQVKKIRKNKTLE
jgi:hypothetical protein